MTIGRWRKILVAGGLVLALPGAAGAGERGVALFALMSPSFPCEPAMRMFEKSRTPSLALLWDTFGTEKRCLKRWFDVVKERPHLLEVHLSNEACRRNRRCEPHEFLAKRSVAELNKALERKDPETLDAITTKAREIRAALEPLRTEKTTLLLSTGLEDNFTEKAFEQAYDAVKKEWPYGLVRSPVNHKAGKGRADYLELHGADPTFAEGMPCIANLDGHDIKPPHRSAPFERSLAPANTKSYMERYAARCRVAFLWSAPWQGIHSPAFVPPSKRAYSLSEEDVRYVQSLLEE